jgi:hypothetical protein
MLFGYKSGDLHIGRRVQLVVWLQIMQEWVGIAGVTVYAPTIFSIAGFDSRKSQWISGLNNVFYMVWLSVAHVFHYIPANISFSLLPSSVFSLWIASVAAGRYTGAL